jgi:hypothetical protein
MLRTYFVSVKLKGRNVRHEIVAIQVNGARKAAMAEARRLMPEMDVLDARTDK